MNRGERNRYELGTQGRGRRLKRAERQQRIVELRKAGVDYRSIAKELGISKTHVHRLYMEALREASERLADQADVHVAEMIGQHDALILAHWPTRAQEASSRVIQRSLDAKAKLLGLSVTRVEHSGEITVEHEDAAERRRRILEETADEIAAMTPEQLAAEAAGL